MQKSTILYLPVLLVVILAVSGRAQDPVPSPVPPPSQAQKPPQEAQVAPCPQLNVQPQTQREIRDGQPVVFTANFAGGDPKAVPTIVWNVSAGTISKGQNTRNIVVDSTGAGGTPDREIRADIWIGGYAPECVLQASAVVKVIAPAVKFGEFGVVPDEVVTRNLKALASFLSGSPDDLRVMIYAGRNSERGFTYTWAKRIKAELVANGVSDRRITVLDGGFREEPLFDFWIVPIGADPPRPSPTIDRREIARPRTPAPKKP